MFSDHRISMTPEIAFSLAEAIQQITSIHPSYDRDSKMYEHGQDVGGLLKARATDDMHRMVPADSKQWAKYYKDCNQRFALQGVRSYFECVADNGKYLWWDPLEDKRITRLLTDEMLQNLVALKNSLHLEAPGWFDVSKPEVIQDPVRAALDLCEHNEKRNQAAKSFITFVARQLPDRNTSLGIIGNMVWQHGIRIQQRQLELSLLTGDLEVLQSLREKLFSKYSSSSGNWQTALNTDYRWSDYSTSTAAELLEKRMHSKVFEQPLQASQMDATSSANSALNELLGTDDSFSP
jgi:hypothetical protein